MQFLELEKEELDTRQSQKHVDLPRNLQYVLQHT